MLGFVDMRIALIIPTKDRPREIRGMLQSVLCQTKRVDQLIIIDASKDPITYVFDEFPQLNIQYYHFNKKPSAAKQRNYGINYIRKDVDLVCFFDDDQTLYSDAIEKMLNFWENLGETGIREKRVGATSFYDASWKDSRKSFLKKSWISERLGLYRKTPGSVARSGWQSIYYGDVDDEEMYVEWMSSQAMVVRRDLLEKYCFDPYFEGSSYLEDLDFSYTISRDYQLAVIPSAKFNHHHSKKSRDNGYFFGRTEVKNRLYIVKKHGFSLSSFWTATLVRFIIHILNGSFDIAMGNIVQTFVEIFAFKEKGKRSSC